MSAAPVDGSPRGGGEAGTRRLTPWPEASSLPRVRKLVFFCRRRADLGHEAYAERLLRGHVPIALRHHPSMRRYVVNVVDRVVVPGSAAWDSIGELSFDSLRDYRERLYDSPEGREIVGRDVAGFLAAADAWECTEHIQRAGAWPGPLGERSPGVKMVAAMRRSPGLDHAAFVDHWLGRHVPLALARHPGLVRYVTNVVDAPLGEHAPSGEALDGIAELHFASEADLRDRMYDSPEGRREIEADIVRFIGGMEAWLVSEWPCRVP